MTETVLQIPISLEIPIGPQHPALHEPVMLKVYADGEEVVKVEINTGYNHRGVEKLFEMNSFYKGVFISARICGICNTVHANVYVRGIEQLLGLEPSPRAKYLRVLAMELERIHSHMIINAIMAEILGFDTLFMLIMRDRELVMKAKEILTGGRVLADYYMPGGVRRDIDDVKKDRILDILKKIRPRLEYYKKLFEVDPTITNRLVDVGVLKPRDITLHGLVGPIARGSGVKTDVRAEDKYEVYGEIPWNVITRSEGDSLARMLVRWDEAIESLNMCEYILTHLPGGQAVVDERKLPRVLPLGEAFTRVEAPRGELTYYIIGSGRDRPYRVKVRTPSFHNIINSGFSYLGYSIADVPVILVSYDPCISCMERAILIKDGEKKYVSLRDIVNMKRVR
ncbi:MAG: nickel-dependent hydrogenase large subunit [Desulfurococcaceae archaeon]|nr:nickel-dependent hydrogenase large subunit [Desulfurococcaceae archaeon]